MLICLYLGGVGVGGRTNEVPGIDHVTSGPMREKNAPGGAHRQTDGHGDSMTETDQLG